MGDGRGTENPAVLRASFMFCDSTLDQVAGLSEDESLPP
jgi:hypothetical protein